MISKQIVDTETCTLISAVKNNAYNVYDNLLQPYIQILYDTKLLSYKVILYEICYKKVFHENKFNDLIN